MCMYIIPNTRPKYSFQNGNKFNSDIDSNLDIDSSYMYLRYRPMSSIFGVRILDTTGVLFTDTNGAINEYILYLHFVPIVMMGSPIRV